MLRSAQFFALATAVVLAGPGAAIEMTVQSSADRVDANPGDGLCDTGFSPGTLECTLRAAIMEANALPGPDTIRLFVGTYTLSIPPGSTPSDSEGNLRITDDLTIVGGSGRVIDGGGLDNVFSIVAGPTVTIRDLVVRNGDSTAGGCIAVFGIGSDLVLERVGLFDCEAGRGGGLLLFRSSATLRDVWIDGCDADSSGGGIQSEGGSLLLERSTISHNTAFGNGGGLVVVTSGEIDGATVLVNSTVRGNLTGDAGGGVYVSSSLSLYNSAVVENVCAYDFDGVGEGGGLSTVVGSSVRLANSVVAGNSCGPLVQYRTPRDCIGSVELLGYNFIGLIDGCTTSGTVGGDTLGTGTPLDPGLGPFGDYGGFAPTRHPTPSSPLVDAGNPAGCEADHDGGGPGAPSTLGEDQRREPRPVSGRCDIGPLEAQWIFADGFESGDVSAW